MLDALGTDTFNTNAFNTEFDNNSVIALLPGTRDYAVDSLKMMLAGVETLGDFVGLVAWARSEDIPKFEGWQKEKLSISESTRTGSILRKTNRIFPNTTFLQPKFLR